VHVGSHSIRIEMHLYSEGRRDSVNRTILYVMALHPFLHKILQFILVVYLKRTCD